MHVEVDESGGEAAPTGSRAEPLTAGPPSGHGRRRCRGQDSAAAPAAPWTSLAGYTPRQPVLRRMSLQVQAGEHVAVIGRTGAGRSSILLLIAGLYSPWSRHIKLATGDGPSGSSSRRPPPCSAVIVLAGWTGCGAGRTRDAADHVQLVRRSGGPRCGRVGLATRLRRDALISRRNCHGGRRRTSVGPYRRLA